MAFERPYSGQVQIKKIAAAVPGTYTAGNRFTIAHGFTDIVGNAAVPVGAIAQATATDADGAITAVHFQVVKMDATNVTLRTDAAASTAFTLFVF